MANSTINKEEADEGGVKTRRLVFRRDILRNADKAPWEVQNWEVSDSPTCVGCCESEPTNDTTNTWTPFHPCGTS